ncbi:DUF2510 domain-containing protein [Mycobacteroides abscessus]|uniref:DUF2510 domain-containing protein n=1 Tax=Mycobacteroides abscessus TaxID=36809 RepID=UPI000940B448|nr:DUF2510 domain-containing protein [Mycobacteroides abscessus]
MTAPVPAPGWFPDPSGAPQQRYFDGVNGPTMSRLTHRPGLLTPNHLRSPTRPSRSRWAAGSITRCTSYSPSSRAGSGRRSGCSSLSSVAAGAATRQSSVSASRQERRWPARLPIYPRLGNLFAPISTKFLGNFLNKLLGYLGHLSHLLAHASVLKAPRTTPH